MNQKYLVVEFAQSLEGQVKRIRISHRLVVYLLLVPVVIAIGAVGLFSKYVQMSWTASRYYQLREDFEHLRARYKELQQVSNQHSMQMASLENLANEVSAAYGINPPASTDNSEALDSDTSLNPSAKESLDEFNFLKAASYTGMYHHYGLKWQTHTLPTLWPVDGIVRSSFGGRMDPFSGEGTFHTGIDLAAEVGTPVHATADGVVASAGWSGRYGKLVVIDHGNGLETYYAHLSKYLVIPGQEVRSNQVIALTGGTGRVTGPHMHYEVRLAGAPVNPYRYLSKRHLITAKTVHSSDLGL